MHESVFSFNTLYDGVRGLLIFVFALFLHLVSVGNIDATTHARLLTK